MSAALVLGAALGVLNFVFAPRLGGLFPVTGLALPLALFSIYFGLFFLIGAGALVVHALRERRISAAFLALGALMAVVGGFGIGSVVGGWLWAERSPRWLDEAVQWCDSLRPELESYRAAHGTYPSELDDVVGSRAKPLLERTLDLRYTGASDQFEFAINVSRGLAFRGARFESSKGAWER